MNTPLARLALLAALTLLPLGAATEDEAVELPEFNLTKMQTQVCRVVIEVERYRGSGMFDRYGSPVFKQVRVVNLATKEIFVKPLERIEKSDSDRVKFELKAGRYAVVAVLFENSGGSALQEVPLSVGFEISERFLGKATKLQIRPQDSME